MGETESKLKQTEAERRQRRPLPENGVFDSDMKRLPCGGDGHRMTEFRCMTPNCKQSLCENCAPSPDIQNKVYCRLCRLMASNIDLMQWEDGEVDEIVSFCSGGNF